MPDDGPSPDAPTQTIGHYRIVRELGRGGQGVVHLAEDMRLHRSVALKVLTGIGPGSEDSVQRFRREAEVASRLEHPGICGIHDAGVADGVPYIAMQFVEGKTLAERIAAAKSSDGRKSGTTAGPSSVLDFSSPDALWPATAAEPDAKRQHQAAQRQPGIQAPPGSVPTIEKRDVARLLRVFEKTALALHAAHEAGIVHRDIKPGNIMVTAAEEPVILDFGLARADDVEQTVTRTGDVFGTPAYMSPEQISGQRIRLDRRSDVYSLGVALYECLTLKRPFDAPTREAVYQAVMTKDAPDPRKVNPAISKDLRVVLETALEKDRDRRYATAEAFAHDVRAVLEDRPIQARPVGPVGRFVRWAKREPAKAALLVVLLAALPTIAVLVTARVKDRPQIEAARQAMIEADKDAILADAGFEVTEGDAKKAVDLYTQVLGMEGGSPEAAGGLVLAHLRLKNAGTALELIDRHKDLIGDGFAAHMLRSDAYAGLGRSAESRIAMEGVPEPKSAFEHLLCAQKQMALGEAGNLAAFRVALHHITAAAILSPAPRLSLLTLRAHAAGHLVDRNAIVESCDALAHHWPGSASSLRWRAFALGAVTDPGMLEQSVALYREAVRVGSVIVGSHICAGSVLQRLGRYEEAIAAGREALKLSPGLAGPHADIAACLALLGRKEEGLAELREAIKLDPSNPMMRAGLGRMLLDAKRFDEAAVVVREALRLQPDSPDLHHDLAKLLDHEGKFEEAIAEFREALRLKPDSAIAHHNLAKNLNDLGRVDEAIAEFREALRLEPNAADTLANLGVVLSKKGLAAEAIKVLRESLRLAPDAFFAHATLADVLCGNDRPEEAVAEAREAIRLDPKNGSADYLLGLAYQRMGFVEESEAAYREALKLDPDHAETHCNLGMTLVFQRRFAEGLEEHRRGHELGSRRQGWPYPSAQWVQEAEAAVGHEKDLEAQLHDHLDEKTEPEAADDLFALAVIAFDHGHPGVAARWFEAALTKAPRIADDLDPGPRRFAARAAARAAIEPGVAEPERVRLRTLALGWLEADVKAIEPLWTSGSLQRPFLRMFLLPLQRCPELAPVRGAAAIANLPDSERAGWTRLWSSIDSLLAAANRNPASRPESR